MKTKFIILVIALISLSCKEQVEEVKNEGEVAVVDIKQQTDQTSYATYGEKITAQNLMAVSAVKENYKNLKAGDTTTVKFKAPIDAVCKSKGCWMRLDLGEEEVFVKFKDYAFFVPTDATGEAIVEETSVQEQQHLALDAGMSADDIAAIIAPKRELKLMATGVLMEK
jgi:hypothetical protein